MFRRACDGKGENDMEQMMYDGRVLPVLADVDVLVVGGGFPASARRWPRRAPERKRCLRSATPCSAGRPPRSTRGASTGS
jgi:hypothetical protein